MFTNWKTYLYIGIAILALFGASKIFALWQDYQALKFAHETTLQNQAALEDSLTVAAGKETVLASQVRDLKSENQDLKGKNVALQIKNKALLDSLHSQGDADSTILTDSTAKVTFKGKEKFAHFSGWTLADLRDSSRSKWSLNMWFDDIDTRTVLFQDTDELWKLKSISLTEGVRVKGISTLDDDTFAALQKYSPPIPPKNFGLNLQANTENIWGGVIFRFDERWYLNANYRIVNTQPKLIDNVLIGVSYFLF